MGPSQTFFLVTSLISISILLDNHPTLGHMLRSVDQPKSFQLPGVIRPIYFLDDDPSADDEKSFEGRTNFEPQVVHPDFDRLPQFFFKPGQPIKSFHHDDAQSTEEAKILTDSVEDEDKGRLLNIQIGGHGHGWAASGFDHDDWDWFNDDYHSYNHKHYKAYQKHRAHLLKKRFHLRKKIKVAQFLQKVAEAKTFNFDIVKPDYWDW